MLKNSSIGFKAGEYGALKITLIFENNEYNNFALWIGALSMKNMKLFKA